MNRSIRGYSTFTRRNWQLPISRLGDAGLAAIWVILAFSSIRITIEEAGEESVMASAHHAVSALILCICAVLFIIRKPAISRSSSPLANVIAVAGSWLMPVLIMQPLTSESNWLLTMTTSGLVLTHLTVFWSLFTLRRSFSIFPEARALIRTGPYALVRHPLYAAYFAMYPCFLLPRLSVWTLLVTVLGVACELIRARDEEAVLQAAFPDYFDYAATTPKFFPRLSLAR